MNAVVRKQKGYAPSQVARKVVADNRPLRRWKRAYDKGDDAALAGRLHPGRAFDLSRHNLRPLARLRYVDGPCPRR